MTGRSTLLAVGAALLGAALFAVLGVPAGALVGSTIAATTVAALKLDPGVPSLLRDLGFTTIGVTLGAGISPSFLSDLGRFPVSLAALTMTILLVMIVSSWLLRSFFKADRPTSILASSPGALSYALSLSTDGRGGAIDVKAVMVLQSLRLLLITIVLPPVIAIVDGATGHEPIASIEPHTLDLPISFALIAVSALVGSVATKLRVPAAYLLAGVTVSGIGHGMGLLEGRPAAALTFIGFSLAGAVIGSRFAKVTLGEIRTLGLAGLVATGVAVGLSGFVSLGIAEALDLPFGQVWVSFAPGGVEGMSAMALSLGYDPAYVATHHVFRLILIIAVLPLVLRRPSGAGS
ncbi:AbrB family transcriptional regulator [Fulvimarina sp. 2208YS6-2-32]|uniref:AbrB family transcriptional regulator n=1 Tax=Fulvimarina uroteuthidis TaxID=3098149 RepID=A0ABU5I4K8_9HYPH|nr:AbrB family transcriptional regulator [Fulvimarina sp. 2208YS6-2-32]MDY8110309.1 AbrB family transcriptional regulator [Fulvimarina sp. 2208YS6-2-32]